MSLRRVQSRWLKSFVPALVCVVLVPAFAGDVQLGPTGAATAVPDVPAPPGQACVVPLFDNQAFADFTPKTFSYAPPPGCAGPWAKVVLEADYRVTTGRQFDRTASIWIGGVNVYLGTTQEPSAAIAPSWHVEQDLTDYASLLRQAQSGRTILGNVVDGTYTGVIHGSARLVFHPGQAPNLPDRIVSLSNDASGDFNYIHDATERAGKSVTLPRNMTAIYMDVLAQSQSSDEFWYLCVPDGVADELYSCPGSGFREAVVYVDGRAAGVAPVYPWIYTGGVSPALWRPIPGVQTFNFKPFRVNLTPFAGQLNDGLPHRIDLGVTNAQSYFATAASLLVYQDKTRGVVSGGLVQNTLQADPGQQDVIERPAADHTIVGSTVNRDFTISGYVDTAQGRVQTSVRQTVAFDSSQDFVINDSRYSQRLAQMTTIGVTTSTRAGSAVPTVVASQTFDYPLGFVYDDRYNADGSETLDISADQGYVRGRALQAAGARLYSDGLSDHVTPAVRYNFGADGSLVISPWTSAQAYGYSNSLGQCYSRRIASDNYNVTSLLDGAGCPGGSNAYQWLPSVRTPLGLGDIESVLWRW